MSPAEPNPWISLLPYLVILLICFFVAIPICRRKGRSIGWAFVVLVPLGGVLVLFYLISLTDKQVLDRLAQLETKQSGQ